MCAASKYMPNKTDYITAQMSKLEGRKNGKGNRTIEQVLGFNFMNFTNSMCFSLFFTFI